MPDRRMGIGPQPDTKNSLLRRLRFHQSWYRATVLQLPYGRGPTRGVRAIDLGNMLDESAGSAGINFLTPEIRGVADERMRLGSGVEQFRCRHNMLSSQPMCFNLFGPLVADGARATRLGKALLGEVLKVEAVTQVVVEFAPPKDLCLSDRTSFDAFIEYETVDGRLGFVGIETKLSEPFTRRVFDNTNYVEVTRAHPEVWPEASRAGLAHSDWAQLWRNHMLVVAHKDSSDRGYSEGTLMVVHHDLDDACHRAIQGYNALVTPEHQVMEFTLGQVVDAWESVAAGEERAWLDAFRRRYVDLSDSQAAYESSRHGNT